MASQRGRVSIFSSIPSWTLELQKLATVVSQVSFLPVLLLVRCVQVKRKGENELTLGLCFLRSLCSQEVLARLCWDFSVAATNGGHFLTALYHGFLITNKEAGVVVAWSHS